MPCGIRRLSEGARLCLSAYVGPGRSAERLYIVCGYRLRDTPRISRGLRYAHPRLLSSTPSGGCRLRRDAARLILGVLSENRHRKNKKRI